MTAQHYVVTQQYDKNVFCSVGCLWHVATVIERKWLPAEDDARAIAAVLNEHDVLIQALRKIERLAAANMAIPGTDYVRIYSEACAALNYAEVTE